MKEMLQSTIQEVVIETIKEVDIKSIIKDEIEKTTKRVADDLFGNYGDFRKQLEEKLKGELLFNINKLTVPDFGNFAIETVVSEIKKIEHEEKDRVAKETEKRLRELLGTHKEAIALKELQDVFAVSMYDEHIKDTLDTCYAEHQREPESLYDVLEILQDENPFELSLVEKEWGTYGKYCMTHIYMKFSHEKDEHHIELHVSRERDIKKTDDDFYQENEKNLYKILGISINGKSVNSEGFVALDMITEPTEEKLVSRFINGAMIDATDLADFELESE